MRLSCYHFFHWSKYWPPPLTLVLCSSSKHLFVFSVYFLLLLIPLCPFFDWILSIVQLSYDLVAVCVCVSMSSFSSLCVAFSVIKQRERDFLKTLRLVSGREACAAEQHGDMVDDDDDDDDKGVRVACTLKIAH